MASNNELCLIFRQSPVTLRENSAAVVAAQLWRTEIVDNGIRSLKNIHPRLKASSKITTCEQEAVDKCTQRMAKSLVDWLEFHFLRVFYPHVECYDVLKYYDSICWRVDCSIDFDRTAKNVMTCGDLSKVTKYKMACLYCFEDDVRTLWPDVITDIDIRGFKFIDWPLMYYWHFCMNDGSTLMEGGFQEALEGKLIEGDVVITWSAMLYLWTKCDPGTKLGRAVNMLRRCSENWPKNLLSLFTRSEMRTVIKKAGVDVMRALARSPNDAEYALQMWRYMSGMVTGEDFVGIMDAIGKLNSARGHILSLLYGIWQHAPDCLKNYAKEKYLDEIMRLFYGNDRYPLKNLARDMSLLIELLSHKTIEFRNQLWCQEWNCLIEGTSADSLNKLMKVCFKDDREIATFKKTHFEDYSEINYYCELLTSKGYFDELNEFLNFCTPDAEILAGLKKKIVWSESFVKYSIDYYDDATKTHAFQKFLSDVYPEPRHRMNLKCQVFSSFWKNGYLRELINGRTIYSIRNLLRMFLTRENDQKKVKKSFKQICLRVLNECKFKSFNAQEWDDVLLWCMNDNKTQLDQFKKSIHINDVYPILFNKWIKTIDNSLSNHPKIEPNDFMNVGIFDHCECDDDSDNNARTCGEESVAGSSTAGLSGDLSDDSFDDEDDYDYDESNEQNRVNAIDRFNVMDDFLLWYFGSSTKVNEFKTIKIREYKKVPLSNVFASDNVRLKKIVLYWFNCNIRVVQKSQTCKR